MPFELKCIAVNPVPNNHSSLLYPTLRCSVKAAIASTNYHIQTINRQIQTLAMEIRPLIQCKSKQLTLKAHSDPENFMHLFQNAYKHTPINAQCWIELVMLLAKFGL